VTTQFSVPIPDEPTSDDELPAGLHPEDPDDEWAVTPARGFRVRAATGALILLVVLAGGFWGGALAEKHHGTGTSSTLASLRAAARSGALGRGTAGATGTAGGGAGFGAGGFGAGGTGFGGAGGAATTGTVIGEQGNTLYVSDANGNIVKVVVGKQTTVTRTGPATLSGLKNGDTVVVSGSRASNGSVSATSVRAVAAGTVGAGGSGTGRSGSGAGGGG
jgi:hypothetical protein